MRIAALLAIAISLSGCASVPLATGLAVAGVGIAGAGLGVTMLQACRADGGCKKMPLPK